MPSALANVTLNGWPDDAYRGPKRLGLAVPWKNGTSRDLDEAIAARLMRDFPENFKEASGKVKPASEESRQDEKNKIAKESREKKAGGG